MVNLTETAVSKVKEILDTQEPKPAGLRISVVGGGCSGFSYSMAFENTPNMLDKTYSYNGLKIFIDQASLLYLDGAQVDYVESLEGSGFKFNNPQVKSTCGCGSSFSVCEVQADTIRLHSSGSKGPLFFLCAGRPHWSGMYDRVLLWDTNF